MADPSAVWRLWLVAVDLVDVGLFAGASALMPTINFLSAGSLMLPFDTEPWFTIPPGAGIALNLSAAVRVYGLIYTTP